MSSIRNNGTRSRKTPFYRSKNYQSTDLALASEIPVLRMYYGSGEITLQTVHWLALNSCGSVWNKDHSAFITYNDIRPCLFLVLDPFLNARLMEESLTSRGVWLRLLTNIYKGVESFLNDDAVELHFSSKAHHDWYMLFHLKNESLSKNPSGVVPGLRTPIKSMRLSRDYSVCTLLDWMKQKKLPLSHYINHETPSLLKLDTLIKTEEEKAKKEGVIIVEAWSVWEEALFFLK